MEDNKSFPSKAQKQILLTEANIIDVYKQLTGISNEEKLSDKEIEKIKNRFYVLVNYKSI